MSHVCCAPLINVLAVLILLLTGIEPDLVCKSSVNNALKILKYTPRGDCPKLASYSTASSGEAQRLAGFILTVS